MASEELSENEQTAIDVRAAKLAVVLRDDLAVWQKLNVTAFLVSGIGTADPGVIGAPYLDGSGNKYLSMFIRPVLVFGSAAPGLNTVLERARGRGVTCSIFTRDMFQTGNDIDNRAAVARVAYDDLDLAGLAFHAERRVADKILKGVALHS